jgi:hypothetical protein
MQVKIHKEKEKRRKRVREESNEKAGRILEVGGWRLERGNKSFERVAAGWSGVEWSPGSRRA